MNFKYLMFALLLTGVLFTSCDDDDPQPENEEEVITTLTMTFAPDGGGTPVTFQFKDVDGDGGNAPTITNGTLAANTTYNVSLELLNESETPVEDITEEIKDEDDEHQFFFQVSGDLNLSFAYADADGNGNPVGLETVMLTSGPSSGTLRVTLRHEPDKSASGVNTGDITNAGGETDIEVDFDVTIQ